MKNKVDILTSASCLVVNNICVPTKTRQSVTSVSVVISEDTIIKGNTEALIPGQVEEDEEYLLYEKECLVEPLQISNNRLEILSAREIVNPAGAIPVRVVNTSPDSYRLKAGTKVWTLLPFEIDVAGECLAINGQQQNISVKDIIIESVENNTSILSETEKDKLIQLLLRYSTIESKKPTDLGCAKLIEHRIDTGNAGPIRMAPRRIPYFQHSEVQADLAAKEEASIIKKSDSPSAFLIVVVRKKDGSIRICVDYRRLNDITKKDAYPLPRIDDIFDALRGAKYFSTLDLASGYYQVKVAKEN